MPTLFHDPTSEPSRAVHWFCLEASIPIEVRRVYLTRGEHLAEDFLAVNPRHQVPALSHDDMTLSEATAIMRYLAELDGCAARWLGSDHRERARVNELLSWYHTNLRLKVTLSYFLPVLLAPAYVGARQPSETEVSGLREAFAETLQQLDAFLGGKAFLAGETAMVPDLLFASELFALDADPDRDRYLQSHGRIVAWLNRMRSSARYDAVHKCWNAVAPKMREVLAGNQPVPDDPSWVADLCDTVDSEDVAPR